MSLRRGAKILGLTQRRNGATSDKWKKSMIENKIAKHILDAGILIHRTVEIMKNTLRRSGAAWNIWPHATPQWRNEKLKKESILTGFRADLIVSEKVIVELKSVERLQPIHFKQLLTYLGLTDMRLGLLINFGENLLKNGFKRVVNGLEESWKTRCDVEAWRENIGSHATALRVINERNQWSRTKLPNTFWTLGSSSTGLVE